MSRTDLTSTILVAIILGAGGCAVIAGYDFGKYQLGEGDGGARTSTFTTSATGTGGTETISSSTLHTGGTGGTSNSSTSTSSTSTTSSSTSSTSSNPDYTTLVEDLECPVGVAAGMGLVWYVTDRTNHENIAGCINMPSAMPCPTTAQLTGSQNPAIAADGAEAYITFTDLAQMGSVAVLSGSGKAVYNLNGPAGGVTVRGSNVYCAARALAGSNGSIQHMPAGGGTLTQLVPAIAPTGPITTDTTTVYWAQANSIMSANLSTGQDVTSYLSFNDTVNAMVMKAGTLYWTSAGGGVTIDVPPDGGPNTYAPFGTPGPSWGVAVDLGLAYFTQFDSVYRVEQNGNVTLLASGLTRPNGVAVDTDNVYVAVQGTCTGGLDGKIIRLAK